jgi:hypothetical protein
MIFFYMYCSNFSSMKIENSKIYFKNGIQFDARMCPKNKNNHKVWGVFSNLGRKFMVPTKTLLLESLLKSFQGSLNLLDKTTPKKNSKVMQNCLYNYPKIVKCKPFRSMRLCLCKFYSLLWLLCHKFCDNMSPWKFSATTMKNKTHYHQKLETYTCNLKLPYHEIMKTCINKFDTMDWITMRLCLCKWNYSLLWPILISNFVSTCHHAKWHL